jgi:hypothetical protein
VQKSGKSFGRNPLADKFWQKPKIFAYFFKNILRFVDMFATMHHILCLEGKAKHEFFGYIHHSCLPDVNWDAVVLPAYT